MPLYRTATGLITRDDFTSLSAWTNTGGKWAASASPALIPFDPSPLPLLAAGGPGSFDYDGVREAQLFIDNDAAGTWWLLYDAGDGVSGWREFLASSTDKGKTWKKQGEVSIGLDNGASGTYSAVANGWLEKRGGVYYLHRVTATNTFAFPDVGLPAIHYFGDIWTATALPGPWTFLRSYGGSGLASQDLLPGSVVLDSGTYYLVSQGADTTSSGLPEIILQTASAPGGPYTIDSRGAIINPGFFTGSRQCENPKVFWHSGLGRYAVLLNLIAADGLHTDANAVVLNDNILNWPSPKTFIIQNANGAADAANAIGVACHITGPEGALVASPDGYVPFTFDGDPRPVPSGQTPNHRGRVIKHAVLEPSAGVATYSDATNANFNLTQALAHGDFIIELVLRFASATINQNFGIWYRQDGTFANGYKSVIRCGETPILQKSVASSTSNVLVSSMGAAALPAFPYESRVRVSAIGSRHRLWIDGLPVYDVQDSSFTTGTSIALSGFACSGAEIRAFRMYKPGPVTLTGLTAGQQVTLCGAGGLPFASGTAAGSSLTLANAHYPLHSVSVDGKALAADDGGLVWGGDTLSASLADAPQQTITTKFAFGTGNPLLVPYQDIEYAVFAGTSTIPQPIAALLIAQKLAS